MTNYRFTKNDLGVYVEGSSVLNPTEQSLKVLEFAVNNGYIDASEKLEQYKYQYANEFDDLTYDWYGDLDEDLHFAIRYLNDYECDSEVVFTFVDNDFVLVEFQGG